MKLEYYTCDRCGKKINDISQLACEYDPDDYNLKHLCMDCKKVLNELDAEYTEKLRAFFNVNKK